MTRAGALSPELVVSGYEILVAGRAIDPKLASRLTDIRIVDYLTLPDLCTFNVGFDTTEDSEDPIGRHPFEIGKQITIRLTARAKRAAKEVFVGEVVTLEPKFSAGGAELTVRAFDRSHRLNRSRRSRAFQQMTASDIVRKILGEAGLTPEVDATSAVHEFVQQSNETDLDFIWKLAHRIGYEFTVMGTKGRFKKVGKAATITLKWPDTIQTFSPRLTAVQQVSEVNVRAWDAKTKKARVGTAASPTQTASIGITRDSVKEPFGTDKYTVVTEPAQSQGEVQAMAKALLDRLANAYVAAEGSGYGNPDVRAGCTVKIEGVGAKFGGTYRVNSTVHSFSGGGTYTMEFSSSAIQTITGAIAASKPPEFASQLVVGIVTNNKDPDGLGRVRVKYPTLSDDVESWWARVLVPNAGSERGVMMLPAVDDEVLIGFEHGDSAFPYVIGSLFGGKAKPGAELASEKGDFGIRSDHKMVMRSKEEMIVSSDKDLEITIKGNGTLKFDGNLKEEVQGQNFEMKGAVSVKLEAGSQLTLKGAMVNIESTGPLNIKGNPIDIKGAMVNIGGGVVNLG